MRAMAATPEVQEGADLTTCDQALEQDFCTNPSCVARWRHVPELPPTFLDPGWIPGADLHRPGHGLEVDLSRSFLFQSQGAQDGHESVACCDLRHDTVGALTGDPCQLCRRRLETVHKEEILR